MGTWWGYACRTCAQQSELWANGSSTTGGAGLFALWVMREELRHLASLSREQLNVHGLAHYAGEAMAWLEEHESHAVRVVESCGGEYEPAGDGERLDGEGSRCEPITCSASFCHRAALVRVGLDILPGDMKPYCLEHAREITSQYDFEGETRPL